MDGPLDDNITTPWEPLRLSHLNPNYTPQEKALATRNDVWHKIIIFNIGTRSKEEVLRALILAAEPDCLIPVLYREEEGNRGTFLAKCGSNTIESFMKHNLFVTLPDGQILHFDVILGFLSTRHIHLNINRLLTRTIVQRFDIVKKVLNFDNFQNDPNLYPAFCPLSCTKVFLFVLRCAKIAILGNARETRLPIRELSLQNNGFVSISPFEKFLNFHLTKLDVRHNLITDVDFLRQFTDFKITELWLDGNPLCMKYRTPEDYIRKVRNIFPHIQKLDGVITGTNALIPVLQQNYLKDGSRTPLIKQFVKHFFSLCDEEDRIILNGLYDSDALFSMTVGNMSHFAHKQITKSSISNRNLLKLVDYSKCHEFLYQGPEKIISALRRQPATVHYLKSFQIDLLHEGPKHLAFCVQGIFSYREFMFPPLVFNRTFIIVDKGDNEFCIMNDQYNIESVPNLPVTPNDLKLEKPMPKVKPKVLSSSEKENMVHFVEDVTMMNRKYSRKYLEDCKWDCREAINTFMRSYIINDVSPEAFVKKEENN